MITVMEESAAPPVSKTQRKKEMHELQALGVALVELPESQLDAMTGHSAQEAARHRRLEALREKLLADDQALTAYVSAHAGADLQALRTLIRNARRDQKEGRPPRAYRELFRVLKSLESPTF